MSSLSRLAPLTARARVAASLRPASAIRNVPVVLQTKRRDISSTTRKEMGPVEAVKKTLKQVDKAASAVALKGIDTGERATQAIKHTVGSAKQETKAKAVNMKDEAEEYASEGKDKAEESMKYGRDKAEESMKYGRDKAEQSFEYGKEKTKSAMGESKK